MFLICVRRLRLLSKSCLVAASASAARRTLLLLLIPFLASCVKIKGKHADHVLIFGFGVVSMGRTQNVATVTRVNSLGLLMSDQPGPRFGLGYVAATVVSVDPHTNMLIETSQVPFGRLNVRSP
jgi:hypothetical protein